MRLRGSAATGRGVTGEIGGPEHRELEPGDELVAANRLGDAGCVEPAATGGLRTELESLNTTPLHGASASRHRKHFDPLVRFAWSLGSIIARMARPNLPCVVLFAVAVFGIVAACMKGAPQRDAAVGATTRRLVPSGEYNWRGATTHALVITVWYPTAPGARMSDHTLGPAELPLFRLGAWTDDAPVAGGRFPLIALSHGTGGSAQIMSWFARDLAAHGYIVAAVNHPGNNALETYTPEGFLIWWERAVDLTTTIDFMLRDQEFGPAIDATRIGAAGFSLGGYTVIELAGGRTAPEQFREFCRSSQADGCADPPEFPGLFTRWD